MHRPLAFVLLLLALTTAACTEDMATIHTSRLDPLALPLPRDEPAFSFVIYGDRTGGPAEGIEVLAQAVEDTNLLDPDLVMTVGDLVEGYNQTPEWLQQMEEYRGVMAKLNMPWYPVAGNHDIYWPGDSPPPGHHERDYEAHFGPLWYWFGHKNAAFIVLYSDEGDAVNNTKNFRGAANTQMSPEQLAWLRQTLTETTDYDHVFVFLHHPRWDSDRYPDSNWHEVHETLAAAGNVTAAFAGHIHRQSFHGIKDGISYYTLATTGGAAPMNLPGSGWLHHLDQVVVRKDQIEVATIPIGAVLDPEVITPALLADIDRARNLTPLALSPALRLRSDGGAVGEVVYRLENKSAHSVQVTAEIISAAQDWQVQPDHLHRHLKAGETAELQFYLRRLSESEFSGTAEQPLSFPVLAWQIDYLGEQRRLSFPENRQLVAIRPQSDQTETNDTLLDQALQVDGEDSIVWIAPEVVRLPDGPFTLEAWFKADDLEGSQAIASNTEKSEFGLFLFGGEPQFLVHLDGNYARARGGEGNEVEAGRWHHMAGVFDGGEVRLYLDGRLIDSVAAAGKRRKNNMPFMVGAEPSDTGNVESPFDGLIDELRISSLARYQGDSFTPAPRFQLDDETVLLLHLDGQELPFVLDATAAEGHGLLVGKAHFVPATR